MMNEHSIREVVIVGGGTAGWDGRGGSLALPQQRLHRTHLDRVRRDRDVGVGEATIPPLLSFNALMESTRMILFARPRRRSSSASNSWIGAGGQRYFHPFGKLGQDLQGIPFHQLYLRSGSASRFRTFPPGR